MLSLKFSLNVSTGGVYANDYFFTAISKCFILEGIICNNTEAVNIPIKWLGYLSMSYANMAINIQ